MRKSAWYTLFATPLQSKVLDEIYRHFADHPFLLCYILGKDYVQHSRHLEKLCSSIINEQDYYQLLEMITLQLYQAKARGDKTPTGHEGAYYSTGRRDSHWS